MHCIEKTALPSQRAFFPSFLSTESDGEPLYLPSVSNPSH